MLFKVLVATVAAQAIGLRPESNAANYASNFGKLLDFTKSANMKDFAALHEVAGVVNAIMLQSGNATDHLTDENQELLNRVIDMITANMYASMTQAHDADVASLAAAIAAINQCYQDFAVRVGHGGDIAAMQESAMSYQHNLNDLQDEVDSKHLANATAWSNLLTHMSLISPAPACPAFPNPRTMPTLDVYFESSAYVTWWTSQKAAYWPVRDAWVEADRQLRVALTAYAVGLASRDVAYCDWKRELEAGCARFEACYEEKKAHYLNVVKPAVEEDMKARIEAYKAGETIIHQIKFLLAEEADQTTPSINTQRYQITFPAVPAKIECDLSALDDAAWVPTPECASCGQRALSELRMDLPRPGTTSINVAGNTLKINIAGRVDLWTGRDGAPIAWLEAPSAETYTFEVDIRLVSAGNHAIVVMSVYDGPDGSGTWPFHFGPRTWTGDGVGVQMIGQQDYAAPHQNPGRGESPWQWHRCRIVRRPGPVWDFSYRPEGGEWVAVRTGVTPHMNRVQGTRIALGLKQASGNAEAEFRNLVVHAGGPDSCVGSPEPVFTMLEGRHFPVSGNNCFMQSEGANSDLPVDGSHYTIEAWVKPDSNIGNGGLVSYGDRSTGMYQAFRFKGGASGFRAYWWGRDLDATGLVTSLADGQWHHIATSWDGQTRRILVDFLEVARTDMTGFNVVRTDNFCVGSSNEGSEPFQGMIQGLKIWKVARSGDQMSLGTAPASEPCRPGQDIIAGTFQHFGHDAASSSDLECNERCQGIAECTGWVRGRAPSGDPNGNAHCWLTKQVPPVWEADGSRVGGTPGCVMP